MTEVEQILTELAQQIILNNLRHLNQSIEDFNNLLSRDPDLALKNLSMLSKEDQQTPPVIIEKMIDNAGWRIHDGTIDTTKIYLDPCCGRGGILAYLHKHYNVPKENLYGIDIKHENVTLCTKLGFNVIKGDALDPQTYIRIKNEIQRIKGDYMEINRVLMNPPYDGNLHLQVLETTLKAVRQNNSNCEVVSVQPARWLEDPLAEYKQGSDYKKYKNTIIKQLSKLQLVDATTSCKAFNIMNATDLAIYTFNNSKTDINITMQDSLINKLFNKINTMSTLKDRLETKSIEGYRCEVKELTSGTGGHNLGNAESSKIADVNIIWGPYTDGYTTDGKFFTEARQKNQFTKNYFANSIKFESVEEANNFYLSCNTRFYRRLVHLFKWDVHVPLRFLPYMEDYSKVWTDEDYCKFFDLTKEESEFMCRTVDDYRVKDFINYISLEG